MACIPSNTSNTSRLSASFRKYTTTTTTTSTTTTTTTTTTNTNTTTITITITTTLPLTSSGPPLFSSYTPPEWSPRFPYPAPSLATTAVGKPHKIIMKTFEIVLLALLTGYTVVLRYVFLPVVLQRLLLQLVLLVILVQGLTVRLASA